MSYRLLIRSVFGLLVGIAVGFPGAGSLVASTNGSPAVLLEMAGRVEVAKAATPAQWSAGRTNQTLLVGDSLRTGENSRATVRLSNLSVLRVSELTTLVIQPPTQQGQSSILDLKSGATYFFNRERPNTQFRTPTTSGAIRGTEFHLEVAANGSTVLTLLDGEVDLFNEFGQVNLTGGEQGIVEPGHPPRKTAVIDAIHIIQWTLYYPAILDPGELDLDENTRNALAESLEAYRSGDLLRALESYPRGRTPASDNERVYHAAVLLAVGNVAAAHNLLDAVRADHRAVALAEALREMIAAVKHQPWPRTAPRTLATEWLAGSYHAQSRSDLAEALDLARAAAAQSPEFGFAAARVAELEFSFGRTRQALHSLERSLALSPRNAQALALKGFLLSARHRLHAAEEFFDQAIAVDGALGNAWLGRGLVKVKRNRIAAGLDDLQTAAALEPNRALLHAYLGKAFHEARDFPRAEKQLRRARDLDPDDPTAWLYSALLNQQRNRINEAIADLEQSKELNENRGVFRSQLLLDQDRAVRGANLASIYRDAGMTDVSVREANKAVRHDYANYSAHLFLAESYDALRDPKTINLRYETPWMSELLIANLLAPASAGVLSQNISQQEYSRLLERNRFGVISLTEYFSSGDWLQSASQFGILGNSSYALDAFYYSQNGWRPNNDLEDLFLSAKFKQQVTPEGSLYLQVSYVDREAGDLLQYYNPAMASRVVRVKETQEPNIFAGYHHQWSPESHTLFLFARLDDTIRFSNPSASIDLFRQGPGGTASIAVQNYDLQYRREIELYSTELQQIWQPGAHTLVAGMRYQFGEVDAEDRLVRNGFPTTIPARRNVDLDIWRLSLYAYDQWRILEPLWLTAGISYDRLQFPENVDIVPITPGAKRKDRISPKLGLVWTPFDDAQVRATYTRSMSGIYHDSSVRIEPTQIAGFTQAYRNVAPDAVAGFVPGTEFETFGLAFDHRLKTRTYFGVEAELLKSTANRRIGVTTNAFFLGNPVGTTGTRQRVEYEERSLLLTLHQLLGAHWALGAQYRLSHAEVDGRYRDISPAISGAGARNQDNESFLHQLHLSGIYNLPCGFFSQLHAAWYQQSNRGYTPDRPGDDFWHFDAFVGYRFPRRHAEVRLGVLNIGDQDYRLNPLNIHTELPRQRTFTASLKLNF